MVRAETRWELYEYLFYWSPRPDGRGLLLYAGLTVLSMRCGALVGGAITLLNVKTVNFTVNLRKKMVKCKMKKTHARTLALAQALPPATPRCAKSSAATRFRLCASAAPSSAMVPSARARFARRSPLVDVRKKKASLRCSLGEVGATDAWYSRAWKQPLAPAPPP